MTWLSHSNDVITISVWAKPNAASDRIVFVDERGLHISIQAKPDDGKANKAIIQFIAKQLGIPKSSITLTKGHKSRQKKFSMPYHESTWIKLEALASQR